jgi:alkylhydroperoxidase/carboxymuconolactone decarboxylase family protein YurZ
MSKGLEYFKEVYDVVPDWVQKMHDYSPNALDHYTSLRGDIMLDGALSRKEKDILLVGMNAARLYARSMVYHTKGAIDFGAAIPELVEYLLVAYLYKGTDSIKTALKSLEYALSLKGIEVKPFEKETDSVEELIQVMIDWMGDEDTTFIKEVQSIISSGDENKLFEKLLSDGVVSTTMKHLLLVGIYITELQGEEAAPKIKAAREHGATEAQLADVGFICMLTAGIPAWFEMSDSLTGK